MRRPWQRQESRLANLTGGTVNAGSGNGWVRKGDVRARRLPDLIECKWTSAKSFVLKLADLHTLEHHAVLDSRRPVLHIEFKGRTETRRYVVLREEDYFE